MIRNYTEKDMTVYELAQLITPILDRLDSRIAYLEENFVTKTDLNRFATKSDLNRFASKEDLSAMEARLVRKIDQNYMYVNRRIDILSEKFA